MRKRKPSRCRVTPIVQEVVTRAVMLSLGASLVFAAPIPARPLKAGSPVPTAVRGESWLTHLQRSFNETSMGKTGRLGPPAIPADGASPADEGFARRQDHLQHENGTFDNATVLLHGSDLYRMNCRGCHGENGSGAPPEINSVINPVRATSTTAVLERMKAAGMEMSRGDAAKLAEQSKTMLLDRLHHGGQDMPPFPHLNEAEVNSLVAYLRQLAGVRGADHEQLAVQEERVRVGEHIAKSTCHICHTAAGPNPTPRQLYDGAIPPLSTLALRTTQAEFIRKVTRGAPIMMGSPPELLRGRMPVFYYLSEEEATDLYLYLTHYPPIGDPTSQLAVADAVITSSNPESKASETASSAIVSGEPLAPSGASAERQTFATTANPRIAALPMMGASLVMLLLGLGFAFTIYEIKRLSARKGVPPKKEADVEDANRQLDPELAA